MGITNKNGLSFFAVCAMAATAASAGNAIWQGGATGDIANPDNWNDGANLAADYLNFGQDVTATMSADTTVYDVFGNKAGNDYTNRTVVFNMGGHTLRVGGANTSGQFYFRGNRGVTYVFTNGTFWCSNDGTKTNSICTSSSATNDISIIAIGDNTTLSSTFALSHNKNIALRILNGAKAYGNAFGIGGSGEIRGAGSEVCFISGCYVGTLDDKVYNEVSAPPHGGNMLVDGSTLTSSSPTTKGNLYIGNGCYAYDHLLVATNGATIAARNIYVGAGGKQNGILYTSSNNTFKATGAGTSVTAGGTTSGGFLVCGYGYSSGNLLLAEDGAAIDVNYLYTGYSKDAGYIPSNNTFRATGEGTTVNAPSGLRCGIGLSLNNSIVLDDGVSVTAGTIQIGCDGAASNNSFRVSGTGTTVSGRVFIGGELVSSTNTFGNQCIIEGCATMSGAILGVNAFGTGNAMSIRSGATATGSSEVCLGGRSPSIGNDYNGACGRLEVIGEGSTLQSGSSFYIRNNTGDASMGQELFVGDGASVNCLNNGLYFIGDGNRVILSNGTLTTRVLRVDGVIPSSVAHPATNTTFRIEGASARLTAEYAKNINGNDKWLVGAPIFEFVIPEGGWASAPVAINQAFTIGDDTVIRIDAASARAFSRAGGGTVPLISTGTSGKAITADMTALTAGASLPAGCSLKNEGGVISVEVTSEEPTILSFR